MPVAKRKPPAVETSTLVVVQDDDGETRRVGWWWVKTCRGVCVVPFPDRADAEAFAAILAAAVPADDLRTYTSQDDLIPALPGWVRRWGKECKAAETYLDPDPYLDGAKS